MYLLFFVATVIILMSNESYFVILSIFLYYLLCFHFDRIFIFHFFFCQPNTTLPNIQLDPIHLTFFLRSIRLMNRFCFNISVANGKSFVKENKFNNEQREEERPIIICIFVDFVAKLCVSLRYLFHSVFLIVMSFILMCDDIISHTVYYKLLHLLAVWKCR